MTFEWDETKNRENILKHGVSFERAQRAFLDPFRVINDDKMHSIAEPRYFCIGKIDEDIITVRFTIRDNNIRIYGAGMWRKQKKYYEQKNDLR